VSEFCKAKFLNKVGKVTPIFARFSTVGGEKGSADTARDPRGFAVKFYTEEGNYDMVGNNTPVFFIRDPSKFPDFIHTQKRSPQTNLPCPNMFWDFLSLTPESVHQVGSDGNAQKILKTRIVVRCELDRLLVSFARLHCWLDLVDFVACLLALLSSLLYLLLSCSSPERSLFCSRIAEHRPAIVT